MNQVQKSKTPSRIAKEKAKDSVNPDDAILRFLGQLLYGAGKQ